MSKKYHLGNTTVIINSGNNQQCVLKLTGENVMRKCLHSLKVPSTRYILITNDKYTGGISP